MAKLPIYTQRYQTGTRRAAAEDFGALEAQAKGQQGRALQEAGTTLMDFEVRRRDRKDTIERVRAINEFAQFADQESTRMSTEEDLTDTDAPARYNQVLSERMTKMLSDHKGSSNSKAELSARLEGYKGQYSQGMYKASTSAQYKAMGTYMDTAIKGFSDMAGDMPDTVNTQFQALDIEIDKMSAALTPEQEQAYRELGRSQILKSAISTYVTSGDYDAAAEIIGKEGVAETLSPDVHRQIKSQIIVGQREVQKGRIAGEQKLIEMQTILGRTLTPNERVRAAGLTPTKGAQSLPTKIAQMEQALGRPATEAEITKMAGAHVESTGAGSFGKSLKGRSIDQMNEYSAGFANGTLNKDQEQVFMSAINEYTQPITYQNPDTGLIEKRSPRLPEHIQIALERGGVSIGEDNQISTGVSPLESEEPESSQTIWSRKGNIAGALPVTAEAVGKLPLIGGAFEGGGEYARDRQYATGMQRDLVRVLQNNPRYAEGERKAIEQEVSIMSSFMDNPTAYENRLIGLDENLQARQDFAYKTANNPNVSKDERQGAMNILNAITRFRGHLGVPQRVKSVEEAKKLPPGTEFVDPSGRLRTVPENIGVDNAGQ